MKRFWTDPTRFALPLAVGAMACAGAQESSEATAPEPEARAEVEPIPQGYERGPVPHLVIDGAADAIAYYENVFGAEEIYRAAQPDGSVMHAMVRIGDSMVTLSDEHEEMGSLAPKTVGGSPVSLMVYVDDADATFAAAVEHGAEAKMPVSYMFWGDRLGAFVDPFGHQWSVATHVYDVPEDEMGLLAAKAMKGESIEEPEAAEPKPRPDNWTAVTAALVVPDVDEAVAYYEAAFGAQPKMVMPGPTGETVHAEIVIRDQLLMLGRENAQQGHIAATSLEGTPATLTYYVEDAEAAMQAAVEAGGETRMPVEKVFWGDEWGSVADPFGLVWSIATHVEDVSPEEMQKGAEEAFGS